MKTLVLLGCLLMSAASFAGDKVGNGGGVWACVDAQKNISQVSLVDLYEAREEFGLNTFETSETEAMNIVQDRSDFLRQNFPEMYARWNAPLMFVMTNTRYVNAELVVVDDALYRIKPLPKSCRGGQWQYMQFANFTHLGQVLIQKDLWNDQGISPVDKAALVWHEAIYKWSRESLKDRDSVRARQLVGLLFSDLAPQEMKVRIQKVLDNSNPQQPNPQPPPPTTVPEEEKMICMVRNGLSFSWFKGYGFTDLEAKGNAMTSCQQAGDGFHCGRDGFECQENVSVKPRYSCVVDDKLNQLTYLGKGRSQLEALFEGLNACAASGVSPVHCVKIDCK